MPVLAWHGPAGSVTGEFLRSGRCNIFHEDACDVTEVDLLGLPATWEVSGAPCCCARLPCGHTFHVSALAWHCLYHDMRCPMCRRGCDSRMRAASLPDTVRSAFERRLQEADAADVDEEALDELYESGYTTNASDPEESAAVLYQKYAAFERQLRLVVEVRSGAREVYVYESPVHCMHEEAATSALGDARVASDSFMPFRVQRSFARHISSRVASCVEQDQLPISLQFSLTHPLFRTRLETVAVVLPTAEHCDFQLRREPRTSWTSPLVGRVRVRLGAGSVSMTLELRELLALWGESM